MFIYRAGLLVASLIVAQACSSSAALSPSGDEPKLAGAYEATSVNGSTLPVLLPTVRGCALTGLSGAMTLRPEGRFNATYSYREQCQGRTRVIDRALSGRFSVNGSNVVFAADSGFSKFVTAPLVTGTLNGATIQAQSTPTPGTTVSMVLRRR
jgi:hypothetical protein